MEGTIEIICPLYNAEMYIKDLNDSIMKQKNVKIKRVHYILTRSKDNSENILKSLSLDYDLIRRDEFSHSLTREKAAMQSNCDIIVFISQDIIVKNVNWLYELTKPIILGESDATYSRQICAKNSIEKYIREYNYPNTSFIKEKNMIANLGLNTFFFSDASSAIKKQTFIKLNGYDQKNLPTNEDMYIAFKLIQNDYSIKYCAESVVIHSHIYSIKEIYKRYELTGNFFKTNKYFDNYGTNGTGLKLAFYVFKGLVRDKNIRGLFRLIPDMLARYIGMKRGKRA